MANRHPNRHLDNMFCLMSGPHFYGVISCAGDKVITHTQIFSQCNLYDLKDAADHKQYLAKKKIPVTIVPYGEAYKKALLIMNKLNNMPEYVKA